jgi:hypothetical protein
MTPEYKNVVSTFAGIEDRAMLHTIAPVSAQACAKPGEEPAAPPPKKKKAEPAAPKVSGRPDISGAKKKKKA